MFTVFLAGQMQLKIVSSTSESPPLKSVHAQHAQHAQHVQHAQHAHHAQHTFSLTRMTVTKNFIYIIFNLKLKLSLHFHCLDISD